MVSAARRKSSPRDGVRGVGENDPIALLHGNLTSS